MMQPSEEMVVAAARALNELQADACNVDAEDQWKLYGDSMKDDMQHCLAAAITAMPDDLLRKLCEERGCVIVAKEPTEAMLLAARDWSHAKYGKPIGNDAANGCWGAMLAASDPRQQAQDDGKEGV